MLVHTGVKDHTPRPGSSPAASYQVIMDESAAVNNSMDKLRMPRGSDYGVKTGSPHDTRTNQTSGVLAEGQRILDEVSQGALTIWNSCSSQ